MSTAEYMPKRRRRNLAWGALVLPLAFSACSEPSSGEVSPASPRTGKADDAGNDSERADASTTPSTPAWPPAGGERVECKEKQVSCRNGCLEQVGDQSHGCELVLRFANSVFEIGAYESGLYAEQATEAWNHELVRIDSTTFEVTHVAMVDRADRFLAHGQNLYFEQNGGIYELPLAGGPPRYLTAASKRVGVYVYVVADGHIYVPENGGGVRQVALDTGVSTTLWPDHGIGALWVGDEHFFVQVEYPDFDLRRAPRAAPDSLEVIDGDTFLSAEFFHWNTDPDHLYVIESGSYYSLDMTSGALKELSRSVGYTAAKAENFILSSKSFTVGGREETHVMALPRRGGELQLVDNAEADHITALGDYAYLVRDDALLRIPL